MEGTHQQVDVTPCSNRQEGTDTFMVVSLLYSSREGVPLTGAVRVGEGRTDTLKGVAALLPYGDNNYE